MHDELNDDEFLDSAAHMISESKRLAAVLVEAEAKNDLSPEALDELNRLGAPQIACLILGWFRGLSMFAEGAEATPERLLMIAHTASTQALTNEAVNRAGFSHDDEF